MRIVVLNHVTLDGVMQAPARPDEDTRGGFSHGGWAAAGSDETVGRMVGERFGRPDGGLLLGRWSYEHMLSHWNNAGGPFRDRLNEARKYVVSSDAVTRLAWPNSTLLHGDIAAEIAELKGRPGGSLVIMGSGELIRSLLPHRLIDEFVLMIHPLVLGSGRRLFCLGEPLALRLADSAATPSGVTVATYDTVSR